MARSCSMANFAAWRRRVAEGRTDAEVEAEAEADEAEEEELFWEAGALMSGWSGSVNKK